MAEGLIDIFLTERGTRLMLPTVNPAREECYEAQSLYGTASSCGN